MKKIILPTLFLLIVSVSYAQVVMEKADENKRVGYSLPSQGSPAHFMGLKNVPSADLNWSPILTRKIEAFEPKVPNEELIEEIKKQKSILKNEIEDSLQVKDENTRSVTPIMGTNFQGNLNNGSSPLDNSIAISNGGIIVSVSNTIIKYYNTSGTSLYVNDLVTFINDASITDVCDPVVLYDPGSDRFIFMCQSLPMDNTSKILVFFSQTNNPNTGGWWGYWFTADPGGNGDAFDYPKIAISTNEFFVTGNLFGISSGNFDEAIIYQIDKLACYNGSSNPNWFYYIGINGSPFTLLPVSYGQNSTAGPGVTLVAVDNSGASQIQLYQITDDIANSPVLNYWTVSTTSFSPASDAHQAGTACDLNTGDCRLLSGFYLNGIVHFTFHSDYGGGYHGINYNRLTLSTLTNQSSVYGLTGYDYCYPSVSSFATSATDKSVMIGFGRSGSSIFPEVRVVNCDNSMNWSASTLVKSSSSFVSYTSSTNERWGDYTGTFRKNNSTNPSIWMNGMYGNSSNHWDTWIAEIHSSVPVAPVANFNGSPTTGTSPLVVNFNDLSTNSPTSWSWTFTGGIPSTSTLQNPTVSYNNVGNYNVKLIATNTGGSDTELKNNYIHVTSNTGIQIDSTENIFNVFPNPVAETFSLDFTITENCNLTISIFNVEGKLVKQLYEGKAMQGENSFSFNESNLTSGTYFLQIKNEKTILRNEKIIVN
ncbi:MAG: T9SS type A sorting domain-containing protein [Bacteroidota bacterium]